MGLGLELRLAGLGLCLLSTPVPEVGWPGAPLAGLEGSRGKWKGLWNLPDVYRRGDSG